MAKTIGLFQIKKLSFERIISTNPSVRRALIVAIILVFGYIDFRTGYEYSFAIFYLLPVAIAAWYDNTKMTMLTVFMSIGTWFVADLSAGHLYSNFIIPFWNGLVRVIFFCIVAFLLIKVRKNWNDLKKMAMNDPLTALDNTRALDIEYRILRKLSFRKKIPFAVGVIDLDGFKAVNDTHGHIRGDDILVTFASILKKANRSSDVVARLGGDEFAVILLDINEDSAHHYDSRLRELFVLSALKQNYGVDFSMGLAIFDDFPASLEDALHVADQLMYQSKGQGKSQTTIQHFEHH
ncbi:hypothetical protein GCM10023206_15720 [Acinetobacter puyangensis]|uniref:diguanylate cyclase n=1 Tax=Acinetobacter puyangensis TaxID=1096779 RepID=A0A240E917_9GAMM|nr:GGDEF domain-containing protein [Acinetobacter puyangensis]SNX44709.1 diguanylate cyclase (GGDEF) domain-containing protein [Acinetobacter puyangensis]